jgi:L-asparaginase
MATVLPRVAIIGTGGTISTVSRHPLDLFDYGSQGRILEVDELIDRIPQITNLVEAIPVRFRAIDSLDITERDWLELVQVIHDTAERHAPLNGIVVTHGTGTLEETAYFLNLTLKKATTVVLVGAFRPVNVLGSDGPLNLLNAVRVAADAAAASCGVLTVLAEEIHAARDVTKVTGFRTSGFETYDIGMLGSVGPSGKPSIYRRPIRLHTLDTEFDLRGVTSLPRVEIVYTYAQASREPVDAFAAAGVKGIVVAGYATGRPSPSQDIALDEARRLGVQVFLSTRGGSGGVPLQTAFAHRGFLTTDNLNPQKARVLAMLALRRTDRVEELQAIFDRY